MDNRPIGIFDSGLGGLTAFKKITQLLPSENIVYFGDTSRVPYGSKSKETIIRYAEQDVNFLKRQNVKHIVIACGTVSCIADDIKSLSDISFSEVLKPACKAAISSSKNNRIGVIATIASIREAAYSRELYRLSNCVQVFPKACPLFVPMVESALIQEDNKVVKSVVENYLLHFKQCNIDTLILGCTHYPIIKKAISNFLGPEITLIDPGSECAKMVKSNLSDLNLLNNSSVSERKYKFYLSDDTKEFHEVSSIFLGKGFTHNYSISKAEIL